MTTSNTTDLYNKLTEIFNTGNEDAAKDFLIEHIKEFPEDVQKKIMFAFFDAALDKKIESETQKAQIQKEGMDYLEKIDKVEKTIKDKQKVSKLRSFLGI